MRLFPLRSRLGFHWFQDVGFWLLLAVAGGGALQAGAVPPGPRAEHAGIARPGVTRSFGTAKVRPLSKKELARLSTVAAPAAQPGQRPLRGVRLPGCGAAPEARLREVELPVPGSAAPAITDPVSIFRQNDLDVVAHGNQTRAALSPSVAVSAQVVLFTGNRFAAVSTDAGQTFTYVNPATTFPDADGGLTGRQVAHYVPQIDTFVWLLEYAPAARNNRFRLAFATSAQVAAGSWRFADLTPADLGLQGERLDAPDVAVGANSLYVTANLFDAGAAFARTALVRISLADIADGGRFRFHAHLETGYFNLRVAQHCGTRAYWATNDTGDDTVRVYSVDEGVTAVTVNTVAVSSWNRSDFATSTPDGHDWLAAADDRLASASVRGNVLALAWNAGRGTGGSAFPGVAHVRIDLDTMLQTDADVLSSPTEAWAYPSLDWNADGELVVSAFAGGPGKPITSAAVTLTGEPAVTVSGVSSHGPTGEAWGAATCRQHPFFPKLWVWATWDLQGGGGDADAQPRYVLFGRSSDAPTLTGDLYEPDDSAAQARALTDRINQVRSIHTAGNADWAKFTMYGTAAVTITTTGGTEAAIFGPDDPTALRYSDPGTVSGTSLAVSLSAGDYWVRVREQGDDAALPTYTLSLRVAAVPDTYEPDDGVATASVLTPGSLQYHSIHTGGNEDWARFDLAERSSFVLQTDGPDRPYRNLDPANYDTELTLLAANGLTRLGGNDDMDSDQELRYSRLAGTLPAGTYYVRVRHSFETTGFMPLYSLLLTTGAPSDLRLTSPNGGESVNTGTSPTATWTSQRLGGNVKLEFSANRGDNWKTVVASTPNDGSEPWPVPIGGATTQGLLRVSAVGQVGLVDASDADFTVVEQRSITVLSPNSRFTTIPIGLATTISWTSFGVAGSVKLEYTVNGTDWVVIAAATENDGTAPWVTPLTLTTHARVRVTSLSAPVVSDTSDEEFTLGPPTLHLTSPNGGEILESQTLAEITWGTFGSAGGVKIEFSADSGTTWSVIHESVPDNGFKGWQIPPMATTRGRVRISSVLAPTSQDVSATDFTVLGSGAFSVPAVVKFPKTRTGKVKRKVVTLKNPSRFDDVAVTVGTPGAPFRLAEGGGSHLIPPRKSVKLILEFAPVEAGSHEAELVLTSSVQSRPVFRIALKGTAR